jgi:predicted MFS family arabinose efflux permease
MTGIGAVLPVLAPGREMVLVSAFLFGASFFMVPTSVTTFTRKNLDQYHWGPAISLLTVVFAIGQIIGPVAAGALADWMGGTSESLVAGGLVLVVGAAVALAQRPLKAAD